jgi:hypothetical protein
LQQCAGEFADLVAAAGADEGCFWLVGEGVLGFFFLGAVEDLGNDRYGAALGAEGEVVVSLDGGRVDEVLAGADFGGHHPRGEGVDGGVVGLGDVVERGERGVEVGEDFGDAVGGWGEDGVRILDCGFWIAGRGGDFDWGVECGGHFCGSWKRCWPSTDTGDGPRLSARSWSK